MRNTLASLVVLLFTTSLSAACNFPDPDGVFIRGDTNNDSSVNVSDIGYLTNYLYQSGPIPCELDSADVNDDGWVNISDVSYLSNYLYQGGALPPHPFPAAGMDFTEDLIANQTSPVLLVQDGLFPDPANPTVPPSYVHNGKFDQNSHYSKKADAWAIGSPTWVQGYGGIEKWDTKSSTYSTITVSEWGNQVVKLGHKNKVSNDEGCAHVSSLNVISEAKFNFDGNCPGGCFFGAEPSGSSKHSLRVHIWIDKATLHHGPCCEVIADDMLALRWGWSSPVLTGTTIVTLYNRRTGTTFPVTISSTGSVSGGTATKHKYSGRLQPVSGCFLQDPTDVTDPAEHGHDPQPKFNLAGAINFHEGGNIIKVCKLMSNFNWPVGWLDTDFVAVKEVSVKNLTLYFQAPVGDVALEESIEFELKCSVEWRMAPFLTNCEN